MSDEPVLYTIDDGAAVLRLNRPERKNALELNLLNALGAIGREIANDTNIRLVMLIGEGDVFCAGADLKEREGMDESEIRERLDLYRSELSWLELSRFPTVAVLNGSALGGGLELALMCDFRIATEDAKLAFPETRLAIIPGAGGTQRLSRLIGETRALELILLGSTIDAATGKQYGLLNRVTPSALNVSEDAMDWLSPIRHGAPVAQSAALRAIRGTSGRPLDEGLSHERACYEECLQTQDRVEALTALLEKRSPVFTGE